jgi:beta-glucosidase
MPEPSAAPENLDRLIAELTLEEKASLVLGADIWHTAGVERLGVPPLTLSDGPHGLRRQPEEGDHIGIGGSLPATCFPTAAALGSSWDVGLIEAVGAAIGREARDQGVDVVLGPGINIKRSPLCGRNFEYVSEDPLLSGALGAAYIRGIQSEGVGASLKHYAVNNQETDRVRVSADVDERTLREIYLAGFERAVTEASPWTVMCSYNRVNGVHASQNHWLLTEVLREQWGFDGLVMSDWGAVHDRVAALAAGLDLEMPPNLGVSDAEVVAAVREGRLEEAVLDTAVARLLQLVERRRGGGGAAGGTGAADYDEDHRLARVAATRSAVLLKNEGGVLPLALEAGQTVAVIGEFAERPRYQGAGSSQVNPTRVDPLLDALRAGVPEGVEVAYAQGFALDAVTEDEELVGDAVALAGHADVVVVVLGLPDSAESEGFDRSHLSLPANQIALLPRLAEVNERIVVVLQNGSAVQLSTWEGSAPAILEAWLSGQAGGGAIADLLLGAAVPSGKLTETLPLRLEDTPSYLAFPGEAGHVRYGEGVFVGYRAYDTRSQAVSYPFGHGLSYTTFTYADLAVDISGTAAGGDLAITASCTVTNTGDRAGTEIVQVYVGDPQAAVARPLRELKGFATVLLEPGASETVHVRLTARDLSYWSTAVHDWVLEGGEFVIEVGASSRDIRLEDEITVEAPAVRAPLDEWSTLQEWLADPRGAELLQAVARDAAGQPIGILADEELQRVIGNFPLRSLAAFQGFGFDRSTVTQLLEQVRGG